MIGRVSSPRFVGRREELGALEAALGRAGDGAGSVVVVAGEAGIGKSRLISEASAIAERNRMIVAVGECLPLGEGELPYGPLVGALRSLMRQRPSEEVKAMIGAARGELAAVMPELSVDGGLVPASAAGPGSQGRLFEHLLALLAAMAREAPLMLVIEDFHWVDRSTRDFLSFLARAARHEPIAILVSYRSDELRRHHPLRSFLLELARLPQSTRIDLSPFTPEELREQVGAILGKRPPAGLVDRLLDLSEGNPFFTEELLAAAPHASGVPGSVGDGLLVRVEAQSARVRQVLQTVAVMGREADHELLAAVTDLPAPELDSALREAVESYLLAQDPDAPSYSFRHALLREAIYSDLLPGERRRLHLRLARALETHPLPRATSAGQAAELAHHWYEAGEWAPALTTSLTAAAAAEQVYALGEARLHYERALETWELAHASTDTAGLDRLELLRRTAEASDLTGEQERAIVLGSEVVALIDERDAPVEAALAHERLGRYLWRGARDQDALLEYRRGVELMPTDSQDRAFALAAEGQVLMLCNRFAESTARCDEALALARVTGAEAVEAHVLNTTCGNLSSSGDADRAVAAARAARAIARRLDLPEQIGRSYVNGSDALSEGGHLDESIAMAWEGISAARELGTDRQWGDFLRVEVAERRLQQGHWEEAELLLQEVADRGLTGVGADMAYAHLTYLEAERGNFEAASEALDQISGRRRRLVGSMALAPPAAARIALELWAGRPEAASVLADECLADVTGRESAFFTGRIYHLGARAHADLASLAPGDEATRLKHIEAGARLLERLDHVIAVYRGLPPIVAASRATCAAELSRISGDGDAALWAEAQRCWEVAQNRYNAAYARWRQAEALLAAGTERARVETLVREAHAVVTELGARPLRAEVESLARRARLDVGVQPGSQAPPRGPRDLDLTPREVEVLALLADGLTNREIGAELFISAKTASVHVSRILSKLSVPNRAAAAALAQRAGVGRT